MDKIVYVENKATGAGPLPWFRSELEKAEKDGFTVCDPQPKDASPLHVTETAFGRLTEPEAEALSNLAKAEIEQAKESE